MFWKISLCVVFFICSGCSSFTPDVRSDLLAAEMRKTLQLRDDGILTFTQAAKEFEGAVKRYYPNDYLSIGFYSSAIVFAEAYDAKQIDRKRFDELIAERWATYQQEKKLRDAEIAAMQNRMDFNNALNAAAFSVNRSVQQMPRQQTCTYSAYGSSLMQTCY